MEDDICEAWYHLFSNDVICKGYLSDHQRVCPEYLSLVQSSLLSSQYVDVPPPPTEEPILAVHPSSPTFRRLEDGHLDRGENWRGLPGEEDQTVEFITVEAAQVRSLSGDSPPGAYHEPTYIPQEKHDRGEYQEPLVLPPGYTGEPEGSTMVFGSFTYVPGLHADIDKPGQVFKPIPQPPFAQKPVAPVQSLKVGKPGYPPQSDGSGRGMSAGVLPQPPPLPWKLGAETVIKKPGPLQPFPPSIPQFAGKPGPSISQVRPPTSQTDSVFDAPSQGIQRPNPLLVHSQGSAPKSGPVPSSPPPATPVPKLGPQAYISSRQDIPPPPGLLSEYNPPPQTVSVPKFGPSPPASPKASPHQHSSKFGPAPFPGKLGLPPFGPPAPPKFGPPPSAQSAEPGSDSNWRGPTQAAFIPVPPKFGFSKPQVRSDHSDPSSPTFSASIPKFPLMMKLGPYGLSPASYDVGPPPMEAGPPSMGLGPPTDPSSAVIRLDPLGPQMGPPRFGPPMGPPKFGPPVGPPKFGAPMGPPMGPPKFGPPMGPPSLQQFRPPKFGPPTNDFPRMGPPRFARPGDTVRQGYSAAPRLGRPKAGMPPMFHSEFSASRRSRGSPRADSPPYQYDRPRLQGGPPPSMFGRPYPRDFDGPSEAEQMCEICYMTIRSEGECQSEWEEHMMEHEYQGARLDPRDLDFEARSGIRNFSSDDDDEDYEMRYLYRHGLIRRYEDEIDVTDYEVRSTQVLMRLDQHMYDPGNGLIPEKLRHLVEVRYKGGHDPIDCLCGDVLKPGELVKYLSCAHVFHSQCIDNWLSRNAICPIDRRAIG